MKSNSKIAAKIVPFAIGLVVITACIVWAFVSYNKGTVIPFSAIEKQFKRKTVHWLL
ncbi:hypothetical protein ACI2OX_16540 [Bacillus sp. N9]